MSWDSEVVVVDNEEEDVSGNNYKSDQPLGLSSRRSDSFNMEFATSTHANNSKRLSMSAIMHLAFQSLGVVYGDIGTSPLYAYAGTFTNGIKHNDDILGVLSLLLYTLTLIPLIKYGFIVLRANDNGDGGTFALYSVICRYAKVGFIPNQQVEDTQVSNYHVEVPNRASWLKSKLENSYSAKLVLLLVTMLGTSMVIGDGVLSPCISVLSALEGIKEATPSITDNLVVGISIGILICLFMAQRFGTDKVGYTFAPIISLWFFFIGGIGLYNIIKYDPTVLKAINPKYMVDYFIRNKKDAWISLGGIVLAITGTEAQFADVGHFNVRSIQISLCSVTYPALLLTYTGQASFLRKNNHLVSNTFYKSIPHGLYWPMFIVAVLASITASQAMISATFSIIKQSLALGCFPPVKVIHTSTKYEGQVYIPQINYILMIACIGVTAGFKTTTTIGNAYGIAVVFVMTLTSAFLVLIMIMIWKTHILLVITYVLIIYSVELIFLSSVLCKFKEGGYLPLAFATVLMSIMYVWNNVYRRKYHYELNHKVSRNKLKEIACETSLVRIKGLAMFYSELVHGIPPIFQHYVENIPSLHSLVVFVTIKSLPIGKVPIEERFLFRHVEKELNLFMCVVRFGYADVWNELDSFGFENLLVKRLKEFVDDKYLGSSHDGVKEGIENAVEGGIVHLIGESEVIARKGSSIMKMILIDYVYNFVKRNLGQSHNKVFDIPHKRMLKVGMTYEL